MLQRVAGLLLVIAVVSAGASAPFAHVHPRGHDHEALRLDDVPARGPAAHHHDPGAHWHLTGGQAADTPGTSALVGNRHHHDSVALATVAVARPGIRVGAAPALVAVWEAAIAPDSAGRPVPIAATDRLTPPPRIGLAARAPPV